MKLAANLNWKANQKTEVPSVEVKLKYQNAFLNVHFEVLEPKNCYRAEIRQDNESVYSDSCAEIFFVCGESYRNFEFNSLGFCLSAIGKDRFSRTNLTPEEYRKIERKSFVEIQGTEVFWTLDVKIPNTFFDTARPLLGNIYKCADKAITPHYLSLFEIQTKKPDFHRPEFFKELLRF